MSSLKDAIETTNDFIEQVTEVMDAFGVRVVLDPRGDALMLVSAKDTSIPLVWLNTEELVFNIGVADINESAFPGVVHSEE